MKPLILIQPLGIDETGGFGTEDELHESLATAID
jgi:hypothetical protein